MKKAIVLLILSGFLLLPACSASELVLLGIPTQVTIEGDTYETGFYGDDLWPVGLSFAGEEYTVQGKLFRLMDWEPFDCVQAQAGTKTGGTIYCLSSQWQEAKAYYEDPENYVYYCLMNSKYGQEDEKKAYEVEDMDTEKYEELMNLGGTFSYDPFDVVKNKAAEYKAVTFDTLTMDPRPYFTFYQDSKDGHFTSTKANHFFILDGVMYLARYHNMSEHILSAVEIPAETADYFIEIVASLPVD